jgi:hypothetical protein
VLLAPEKSLDSEGGKRAEQPTGEFSGANGGLAGGLRLGSSPAVSRTSEPSRHSDASRPADGDSFTDSLKAGDSAAVAVARGVPEAFSIAYK